ncbi:MAG: NAD-dependent epimerase/dehydratase family protein, partial [Deltaproteobacteria bacterium]
MEKSVRRITCASDSYLRRLPLFRGIPPELVPVARGVAACQPLYVVGSRAILITGARGLVGSHLCDAFADGGWEVRALDRPGTHRSP